MPVFCSNLYIVKLIKFYLVLTLSKEKFRFSAVDLFTVSLVLEDNSKIANLYLVGLQHRAGKIVAPRR